MRSFFCKVCFRSFYGDLDYPPCGCEDERQVILPFSFSTNVLQFFRNQNVLQFFQGSIVGYIILQNVLQFRKALKQTPLGLFMDDNPFTICPICDTSKHVKFEFPFLAICSRCHSLWTARGFNLVQINSVNRDAWEWWGTSPILTDDELAARNQ